MSLTTNMGSDIIMMYFLRSSCDKINILYSGLSVKLHNCFTESIVKTFATMFFVFNWTKLFS